MQSLPESHSTLDREGQIVPKELVACMAQKIILESIISSEVITP